MISYTVTDIYEGSSGIYCVFENGETFERLTLVFRISDFYDAHLSVGKQISDSRFEELYEISQVAQAVIKAEKLLSGTSHSKKQLILKLIRSDIDRTYAEKAAQLMEERGYIDEYSQAERLAGAYCTKKGWGKKRITAELLSKGYERNAVLSAVSFITTEQYMDSLKRVIERKYPNPPEDKKERDRRIAALIRLGYSVSEITEAFRESQG